MNSNLLFIPTPLTVPEKKSAVNGKSATKSLSTAIYFQSDRLGNRHYYVTSMVLSEGHPFTSVKQKWRPFRYFDFRNLPNKNRMISFLMSINDLTIHGSK